MFADDSILELTDACYRFEEQRGIYKEPRSVKWGLATIRNDISVAIRTWDARHDLKPHFECESRFTEDCRKNNFNCAECGKNRVESVPQEVAAAAIKLLAFCEYNGIDLAAEIEYYMEVRNDSRRVEGY